MKTAHLTGQIKLVLLGCVLVVVGGALLLGCAVLVSSQPTIHPSTNLTVREGSSVVFSCSFPRPRNILSLFVQELTPSRVELIEVRQSTVNKSQPLGVLGSLYTLRLLNDTLAEIGFIFNATRAFNGYTLQCISTDRVSDVVSGSQTTTVSVEYPPALPTLNESVRVVIRSTPLQFQLNCDVVGNPSPHVIWAYHNNLSHLITQTGPQNSVLIFRIDSLEMVPDSLYSESFVIVCNASNGLGSATKNITLSLGATPSAPQDVDCKLTESCTIKCTLNEPVFSGSSSITQYQLVIIKNGEEERNLTKPFEPGQTDYSIPKTLSSFYAPNAKFKASIRAVSDVGSSLASSDTFVLPGPCKKPTNLSAERVNQTSVTVSWKTPDCDNPNVPVHTFNVTAADVNGTRVFHREVGNQSTSVLIQSLNYDMEYTVTVVGINCYGPTPSANHVIPRQTGGTASPRSFPSTTVHISSQTTKKSTSGESSDIGPIAGGVGGGVVVLLLLVVGVLYWRYRQNRGSKKSPVSSSRDETMTNKQSSGSKPTNTQTTTMGEYALLGAPQSTSPPADSLKTSTDGLQYAELDHISSVKKGSSEPSKKAEQTTYADIKHI